MRVLNNLSGTHKKEILKLMSESDEFILVSPFLMGNFDSIFKEVKSQSLKKIRLITTIKDNQPEIFRKVNAIKSFILGCASKGIDFTVQVDNDLHGKIYISVNNGLPVKGIITSANFTERGISIGHEWGVELTDSNELKKIIKDLNTVVTKPLSYETLIKISDVVDKHPLKQVYLEDVKVDIKVSHLLQKKDSHAVNTEIRYFIKPVGSKESPYTEQMHPKSGIEELHFAKKPVAVRRGDILICYGVKVKKLLGYFEVTTDYDLVRQGNRWPWGVQAQNLLPDYSEHWEMFDNTLANVQSSYVGATHVTEYGGDNLNSLMYGQDKIRLTQEFAKHLIDTMNLSVKTVLWNGAVNRIMSSMY